MDLSPLKRGFSHISGHTRYYNDVKSKFNRVYFWTGISSADGWARRANQPWELAKVPWGNDIVGYPAAWWTRLKYVNKTWRKSDKNERDLIL